MIIGIISNDGTINSKSTFKIKKVIELLKNKLTEAHHANYTVCDKIFHDVCKINNINIHIHPSTSFNPACGKQCSVIYKPARFKERSLNIIDDADFILFMRDVDYNYIDELILHAENKKKKFIVYHKNG